MDNIAKITTLVMLLIPSIALAAACDPNDSKCGIKNQLQAMEAAGIKPTPVQEASITSKPEIKKEEYPQPPEPQPFKIPPPGYPPPKIMTNPQDQNLTATTQQSQPQTGTTLNIFAPATTDATKQNNSNKNQETTTPTQPTTQPQTGIQYR